MKKINEIFYSLQGEGRNAGRAAVFVRFSGCNLSCPFCDTKHESGKMMTDSEILKEVSKYPSNLVVLTGGEPSLFINEDFIQRLHDIGRVVAIETNGTHPLPFGLNFVTLSPKIEYCNDAPLVVKECDELKVIFTGKNDFSLYDEIETAYRFVQPCDTGDMARNKGIVADAVEWCKTHPEWRLSLQTHKIINIR